MKSSTAKVRALSYVLVTAARNEEEYIERTITSVARQTHLPLKWIIVSDGSTDRTDDIVRQYASEYSWIELIRLPERKERTFAAKARAFNMACEHLKALDYEAIANLDADISFDAEYFAFLMGHLADDAMLGVVGTAFEDKSLSYDYRFVSIEHVAGPCQVFRRACLEQIGGYVPSRSGGVDHIAVIKARMTGWKTRTFTEKTFVHHRLMGTAARGVLAARYKSGVLDYALGSSPLWEAFRMTYQLTKTPYVVGGLALMTGYMSAAIRRVERPVSQDLVRFRRQEQRRRLRQLFQRKLSPQARLASS